MPLLISVTNFIIFFSLLGIQDLQRELSEALPAYQAASISNLLYQEIH
jgi:hypothetical protein